MSGRVLVIGDVMTDISVVPDGPIVRGSDVRAVIRQVPGGSGANQAVWLAAKGADVLFVARVGAGDLPGLEGYFGARGVMTALAGDPDLPTGTLVCLVDSDGERSFLTDRGANTALSSADLPQSLLENVSLLHVSGYSLFEPGPRAAVLALIAAAHASGIAVSIDPASTAFLAEVGVANFLAWTAGADFFFPNAEEAALLAEVDSPYLQIEALEGYYKTVVLKRGALGAMLGGGGNEIISVPGRKAEVVDTTGAGDAFAGGFLAAHLRGEGPLACLEQAAEAGADAITRIGAQP
ncbi:carbohydrate kinase family protein [Pelagibacterium limicola]|uniref:carbohydrate kinase family protein n=1 Tax=Pelagibacterium limicola TaxID=2791022 RepID=UPI0018AF645D|nr:sugar kinase [Pelagibacterium limicola]